MTPTEYVKKVPFTIISTVAALVFAGMATFGGWLYSMTHDTVEDLNSFKIESTVVHTSLTKDVEATDSDITDLKYGQERMLDMFDELLSEIREIKEGR